MYTDGVVILAPFEREDLAQVCTWANSVELGQAIDRVLPVTAFEHEQWYERLILKEDAVTFAIRHGETLVGLCGLGNMHRRHHHAELWIYLGDPGRRGKGLGRRTVRLLARFGFEQLNLHRIYLRVVAYNKAAQRVYRACGFCKEGCDRDYFYLDGCYHGAVRMGLLRGELQTAED